MISTDNENRLHNRQLLEIEEAIKYADDLHGDEPDLGKITGMLIITEVFFIGTDMAVQRDIMSYRGREIVILVWWLFFVSFHIYQWRALSEKKREF